MCGEPGLLPEASAHRIQTIIQTGMDVIQMSEPLKCHAELGLVSRLLMKLTSEAARIKTSCLLCVFAFCLTVGCTGHNCCVLPEY